MRVREVTRGSLNSDEHTRWQFPTHRELGDDIQMHTDHVSKNSNESGLLAMQVNSPYHYMREKLTVHHHRRTNLTDCSNSYYDLLSYMQTILVLR